jgi:hypothetical protein
VTYRRDGGAVRCLKEWGVELLSGELGYCLRELPIIAASDE